MNGFRSGAIKSGRGTHEISVTFINTLDEEIPAGAAVVIDSYNAKLDLFTVRKYQEEDTIFGVVKSAVKKNKIGTAVLVGIAKIKVSGEIASSVIPRGNTFEWDYAEFGLPVLAATNNETVILVSFSGTGNQNYKERPFIASYNSETEMIDISGGWVNCNGEFTKMESDSLGVMDGYICVKSEYNGRINKYDIPMFFYEEPAANCIPIAKVILGEEGAVSIVNFYVSTVIINETALHPPCACLTGDKK
jgi:hypothetical protein